MYWKTTIFPLHILVIFFCHHLSSRWEKKNQITHNNNCFYIFCHCPSVFCPFTLLKLNQLKLLLQNQKDLFLAQPSLYPHNARLSNEAMLQCWGRAGGQQALRVDVCWGHVKRFDVKVTSCFISYWYVKSKVILLCVLEEWIKWSISTFLPKLQQYIFRLLWRHLDVWLPITLTVAIWFNINTSHWNFTPCCTYVM